MSDIEPSAVRAGNAEREQVAARLNNAFAEGRLDVGELDERVAAAYAAKTVGELVPLTADLPASHRSTPPAPVTPTRREAVPARPDDGRRWAPVGATGGIFLLNVLIWAVVSISSGDLVYFWPVWVLIPVFITAMGAFGRGHGGGHGGGHR